MNKKKRLIPVLLAAILAIGAVIWLSSGTDTVKGRVEQVIVPHYSETSGKIAELHIQQGQTVQAGDILAVIDSSAQKNSIAQLEQVLIQQQATLEQTLNGAEPAVIRQAQSAVKAAQAAYQTAQLQYDNLASTLEKTAALYEIGGISRQDYDAMTQQVQTAQNAVTIAEAQLESAQQQVILLSGGSDASAIKRAQAAVAQTELQIAQAKDMLENYTIRAACDGTVISVNYTEGAMIASGGDLAEIADQTQTYVLAYVPEEALAFITCGDTLPIELNDTKYTGTITFIDLEAVYTPEEFQTAIQQSQKEFKIKLTTGSDFPARPGQMVNIHLNSD